MYTHVYLKISLPTLCICIIKKRPCTKPFFFTASTGRRSRGCIPRALVTETRKSGNEKVARGRSGFIENRTVDGTDESFLTPLLPSPLPLLPPRLHRVSRTLSWRRSSYRSEAQSDLSPSFSAAPAPSREYYLNRALIGNGS